MRRGIVLPKPVVPPGGIVYESLQTLEGVASRHLGVQRLLLDEPGNPVGTLAPDVDLTSQRRCRIPCLVEGRVSPTRGVIVLPEPEVPPIGGIQVNLPFPSQCRSAPSPRDRRPANPMSPRPRRQLEVLCR